MALIGAWDTCHTTPGSRSLSPGTQKLYAAMRRYDTIPKRGEEASKEMVWALQNMTAEVPAMTLKDFIWERTACPAKPQLRLDPDALDLISRMLTWDPADRITAAAAIRHRLFRSVVRRSSAAGRTTAPGGALGFLQF